MQRDGFFKIILPCLHMFNRVPALSSIMFPSLSAFCMTKYDTML